MTNSTGRCDGTCDDCKCPPAGKDGDPLAAYRGKHIVLKARQLRAALDYGAPDFDADPDQRDTELCLQWLPERTAVDGTKMEAGLYMWDADYPEEGVVLLSDIYDPNATPISQEPFYSLPWDEVLRAKQWPAELHDDTKRLVAGFAEAMAIKLAAAERKYGYSNGWLDKGWMDECRSQLLLHVEKGDPRDVANYCAFLWHHNEKTTPKFSHNKTLDREFCRILGRYTALPNEEVEELVPLLSLAALGARGAPLDLGDYHTRVLAYQLGLALKGLNGLLPYVEQLSKQDTGSWLDEASWNLFTAISIASCAVHVATKDDPLQPNPWAELHAALPLTDMNFDRTAGICKAKFDAATDAERLRDIARKMSYNTSVEAATKHVLNEIAMRLATGGYEPAILETLDERAMFECLGYKSAQPGDFIRNADGEYAVNFIQHRWEGWQAALASRRTHAAAKSVSVKRSAIECANHLATSAERLLAAVSEFLEAEAAESEASSGAELAEAQRRAESACEAFNDHYAGVKEAIFEYRKRIESVPGAAVAPTGGNNG